mmetsp:Transcript_2976/g.4272  ORF Transcript_2976/g.4272 Transcript_2976/m.4272 type:complete len:153 (-) Transcript_2976:54-512(-)
MGEFVDLDGGDGHEDLGHTGGRDVVDGLNGSHGLQVGEFDALGDTEVFVGAEFVEGDAELLEGESNGCNHGRSAVLELGGTKPGSSGLGSPVGGKLVPVDLSEEHGLSTSEGHGSIDLDLLASEGGGLGNRSLWGEGGSRGKKGGEGKELHG